jgi:hypothetical protein
MINAGNLLSDYDNDRDVKRKFPVKMIKIISNVNGRTSRKTKANHTNFI